MYWVVWVGLSPLKLSDLQMLSLCWFPAGLVLCSCAFLSYACSLCYCGVFLFVCFRVLPNYCTPSDNNFSNLCKLLWEGWKTLKCSTEISELNKYNLGFQHRPAATTFLKLSFISPRWLPISSLPESISAYSAPVHLPETFLAVLMASLTTFLSF